VLIELFIKGFHSNGISQTTSVLTVITVLGLVILTFYLMINRSQTPGKFLLNIQVFDLKKNKRIGFIKFWILREVIGKMTIIEVIPFLGPILKFIYVLFDSPFIFTKNHRTIHDRIAGTIVINLPEDQKRKSFFDFKKLPK